MSKVAAVMSPPTSAPVDPLNLLSSNDEHDIPSLKTPSALSTNVLSVIEPELPAGQVSAPGPVLHQVVVEAQPGGDASGAEWTRNKRVPGEHRVSTVTWAAAISRPMWDGEVISGVPSVS